MEAVLQHPLGTSVGLSLAQRFRGEIRERISERRRYREPSERPHRDNR